MKRIALLLIILVLSQALFAQEEGSDMVSAQEESAVTAAPPAANSITSSRTLDVQLSSLPEAKLIFYQHWKIPALRGDGMLVKGNNLKLSVGAEVTPISMNALGKVVLTPIAFLQVIAGGRVGSGWPLDLFGMSLYGIGINERVTPANPGDPASAYNGKGFDGWLYGAYLGGMAQMDFGLVLPGNKDWNHVVFQSYHEINYKGYCRASGGESWYYEHDKGENRNGFNYYGNILLGYQMPILLDTIAVLTEMDKYLYDTPNRSVWGDDLFRWNIAAVLNFGFTKKIDVKVITQFRTGRNFTDNGGLEENTNDKAKKDALKAVYYQDRHLDTANPRTLHFYRVALLGTFKLP